MATPKRFQEKKKRSASASRSHGRHSDAARENVCSGLPVFMGPQNPPRRCQMGPRQRSYSSYSTRMPDVCMQYNVKSGCNMPGGRCMRLHICQHYINGTCRFGEDCLKSHNIFDPQPKAVLEMSGVDVERSSKEVLAELRACCTTQTPQHPLLAAHAPIMNEPSGNGSKAMPDICTFYNVISGCSKESNCTRLHICKHYISGGCKFGQNCKRSHDIFDPQPKGVLKKWGINVARSPKVVLAELRNSTAEKIVDPVQVPNAEEAPKIKDGEEICIYHLRGQCHYKGNCRNHHCALPYQWQMQSDDTWTDLGLSDNITCELTFCDPDEDTCCLVQPSGTIYKVDFDKFTISDGITDSPVRRLFTTSSVNDSASFHTFTTKWCWYWKNNSKKFEKFHLQGNVLLPQASVTSEDMEKMYEASPNGSMDFSTNEWKYKADFTNMCQYNLVTRRARQLRRRPQFVSLEEFEKLKSTPPKRSVARSDSVTSQPPHWDLSDTKGEFQLIKLSKRSDADEWGTVKKRFRESMPAMHIKSVHRIQNAELWDNYSRKKHHMMKKSGTKVKEILLFHGTASKYVDPICQQGFDWRISGLSVGTLYGKGSYFARDSHYSSKYTDDRRMFVVQVLVGEYCAGHGTYLTPPPKDDADPFGPMYDSCVDKVLNPAIFVIFSSNQAYPAYLIEY